MDITPRRLLSPNEDRKLSDLDMQRSRKLWQLCIQKGYRSQYAMKLIQLDSKYSFLSGAQSVLDLCAAPGGWMQVALKHSPFVVGVDLCPIRPLPGALTLQADITDPTCPLTIRHLLAVHNVAAFDLVLFDGAPEFLEFLRCDPARNALTIDSLKLATEFLAPNGTFVTRMSRFRDNEEKLLSTLKQLFEKVGATGPPAHQPLSGKMYFVCQNYKPPANVDSLLLDIKRFFHGAIEIEAMHLGQALKEHQMVTDAQTNYLPNRGFADKFVIVKKELSAANFVWSESKCPSNLLVHAKSITFSDPDGLPIRDHELTTPEIKSLCQENPSLLAWRFIKKLLRWRISIREALGGEQPNYSAVKSENDEQVGKKRKKGLLVRCRAKGKKKLRDAAAADVQVDSNNERVKKKKKKKATKLLH